MQRRILRRRPFSFNPPTIKLNLAVLHATCNHRELRHVRPSASKTVGGRRGLSTSTIPKPPTWEERSPESTRRSTECPSENHKYSQRSECRRRCESSEKSYASRFGSRCTSIHDSSAAYSGGLSVSTPNNSEYSS